jgi:hypothetical protein
MPPRHAVEQLPDEQLQFVIDHILNGDTDREISFAFEEKFNTKLSKSSLNRWRQAAGEQLAERYRLARYQAKQLIQDLKEDPDVDKHQVLIASIEDRLLTATREISSQDPFKLVVIQQEEKRRNLRERELQLKERAQTFQEEQALKTERLQQDRLRIGADVWQFVLSYLLSKEPQVADLLTKHNQEILNGLEEHLENQTA